MSNSEKNTIEANFLKSNEDLISFISDILTDAMNRHLISEADRKVLLRFKNTLSDLLDFYKDSDLYSLAEIQIGLAKYFDYEIPISISLIFKKEFSDLIKKIIVYAMQIINKRGQKIPRSQGVCGKHEDRACVIKQLGSRYKGTTDITADTWPTLPLTDAVNFKNNPEHKTLEKGHTIFRIISSDGNCYGNWWMCGMPKNRREWRNSMAVLTMWNSDSYFVELKLSDSLKIWQGKAASQRVPKSNCILNGGGDQIWVAKEDLMRLIINPNIKRTPAGF